MMLEAPGANVKVFKINKFNLKIKFSFFQGVCIEAGMYALRERRVHVTQEDFELAVAKVNRKMKDY